MDIKGFDPRKQAFSLFDEFKNFAFKGNVIDMAVGVIIGGAFGDLVKSVVANLLMPLVGALVGTTDPAKGFKGWGPEINGSQLKVGDFVSDFVSFVILALALFIFVVKFLGWIMKAKKQEATAPTPPPPTKDQELLTEIRDLLKAKK